MIYTLPITFDEPIQVSTRQFPILQCEFSKTSGYDSANVRITNLVGFSNGDFLKICRNCMRIFSASYFGLRNMGDGSVRVQSNCQECRSGY